MRKLQCPASKITLNESHLWFGNQSDHEHLALVCGDQVVFLKLQQNTSSAIISWLKHGVRHPDWLLKFCYVGAAVQELDWQPDWHMTTGLEATRPTGGSRINQRWSRHLTF